MQLRLEHEFWILLIHLELNAIFEEVSQMTTLVDRRCSTFTFTSKLILCSISKEYYTRTWVLVVE